MASALRMVLRELMVFPHVQKMGNFATVQPLFGVADRTFFDPRSRGVHQLEKPLIMLHRPSPLGQNSRACSRPGRRKVLWVGSSSESGKPAFRFATSNSRSIIAQYGPSP